MNAPGIGVPAAATAAATAIPATDTMAPEALATRRQAWIVALAVLALALGLMLGVLFQTETVAAIRVWDSSTAYNHCWLVLPVAGWLAWTRRERLRALSPAPLPAAALLALCPALAWFAAERMGIMEGRQLALMGLVWVVFLSVLGWRICRAMAAPLVYLVFLVPFGAFITPTLQKITAWIIEICLGILDIPHYVDDLIIEIPAGTFLVAEACAGLRFLIAALAFGALYAFVMFRSPGRRLIVMALAVVVPIVANGFRAFGIVYLGHLWGSAEAAAADHVIYGWVFFSAVIILLILAGLPFREDGVPEADRPQPWRGGPAPRLRPVATVLAGGLGLALAAAGPAAAARIESGPAAAATALRLDAAEGCTPDGQGGLRCIAAGTLAATARLAVFSPRAGWGAIGGARIRALGEIDEDDRTFTVIGPDGTIWQGRVMTKSGPWRALATAVWLDGRPTGGGVQSRARQALNSILGDRAAPALVVVEVLRLEGEGGRGQSAEERVLRALLAADGPRLAEEARRQALAPPR